MPGTTSTSRGLADTCTMVFPIPSSVITSYSIHYTKLYDFASLFGDWKILFLAYGIISLLNVLWLGAVKIEETAVTDKRVSLGSAFKLLGNSYVLMMVLSIFLVVGIDVGFNYFSGKYLTTRFGFQEVTAQSGRSIYFFGRMLGTFAGALILTRLSSTRGFLYSAVLSIAAISLFMFIPAGSMAVAWVLVFVIGFGIANIFPLVRNNFV